MSLFFVRTDKAQIPPAQKDAARLEIEEKAKQLQPSDPGYAAALVQIVDEVITRRAETYRWSTDDVRILKSEIANLAIGNLSVFLGRRDEFKAQQAKTALGDAKEIMREEDLIFRGFTRVGVEESTPSSSQMLGVIKGLGRLAASLGAPRSADGWYAREISTTVEGQRSDQVGQYGKRARTFMMPFTEIRAIEPTHAENKLLQEVLQNNRQGVNDALFSILGSLEGSKDLDASKVKPTMTLPSKVLNLANLLGTQLGQFRQYADRFQKGPLDQAPQLGAVLHEAHRLYVNHNYTSISMDLRKPFADLDPQVQRRNVPTVLGALYGLVQANRVVGEVIEQGVLLRDGSASEAGNDLQLHLVSSASHAMKLPFEAANATFAGAVADEIGMLLAYRNGAAKQLPQIHAVIESATTLAGEAFQPGGPKAKAAPKIALAHIGSLMKAIDPSTKLGEDEWAAKAKDVLTRARAEDLVAICGESFKIGELPEGQAINGALRDTIDKKDYFYERIEEIGARGPNDKPLDDGERKLLLNMLYLANATWKTGQVHRAIGEGDLSRVNPSERDRVFNPYDMCVTAAGSALHSYFCIAKDLLVLKG
jgi:hypothetical protein